MPQDRCDLICIDAPRAEAIRGRLLKEAAARDAAERAKALSDPTRLTLAEALREGEELCEEPSNEALQLTARPASGCAPSDPGTIRRGGLRRRQPFTTLIHCIT